MPAAEKSRRETWFKTTVGREPDIYLPYLRLHASRSRILIASPHLDQGAVAVFSKYDLEKGLVTWYFTPEAMSLARMFAAIPCEKPDPTEDISLLSGNSRAWQIHFPERI